MVEHIVSLKVAFTTPIDVSGSKTEFEAEAKAIAKFKKQFAAFKKSLNDIIDEEYEAEYVEEQ